MPIACSGDDRRRGRLRSSGRRSMVTSEPLMVSPLPQRAGQRRGLDRLGDRAGEAQRQAARQRRCRAVRTRCRSGRCAARRSSASTSRSAVAVASTCIARTSRSSMTARFCASPKPNWPASARAMRSSISLRGDGAATAASRPLRSARRCRVRRSRAAAAPRRRAAPAPMPVWPRSGARNIGDVGRGAGVLDQVADAHDFGGDGDQLLEPRRCGLRSAAASRPSASRSASSDGDADHGCCLSASGWRSPTASGRRR